MLHKILVITTLLLSSVSCSFITESTAPFISTSGNGEVIINNEAAISLERMALIINDISLEVHLLGSNTTLDSQGSVTGEGASVITTISCQDEYSQLSPASYTIDDLCSVHYSTSTSFEIASREYTPTSSGSILIRESQGVYDIIALCTDSAQNTLIITFTGYIYRTVDLSSDI